MKLHKIETKKNDASSSSEANFICKLKFLSSKEVWSLGTERKYDLVVRSVFLFLVCLDFLWTVVVASVL